LRLNEVIEVDFLERISRPNRFAKRIGECLTSFAALPSKKDGRPEK
jgi:hypothetical protein